MKTGIPLRLFALSLAALLAQPCPAEQPTLIRGATVIDVETGALQKSDILLRGDRIAERRPAGKLAAPADARVIDASGLFAIPGLWDMHIHLTAVAELEDRIFSLLVANGVTGVRDMGGLLDSVVAARERSSRPGAVAPRIFVAGPVIDGSPRVYDESVRGVRASSVSIDTPEEAVRLVDELARAGVDFIKPYEMLRPDVLAALVGAAHALGLPTTGHVPLRMTTDQALRAGLDGIEHLRGMEFDCARNPEELLAERVAMMDAHGSDTGGYQLRRSVHATVRPRALEAQDPERCAALIERFVELGTWHTPTLHFVAFRVLGKHRDPAWLDTYRYLPAALRRERLALLEQFTDETKYREWGEHGRWAMEAVGQMHDAGVRFLAGTDAPGFVFMPGFTLHDELEALVAAGLSPLSALRAATINPARFLAVDEEIGTIEVGKVANVVLLSGDPLDDVRNTRRIEAVVLRGRVLDRAELDAMLRALEVPGQ